jgi:sterol desaturase/sphingolipid hydroxylase (fatty acid hydroxylase superfamily)
MRKTSSIKMDIKKPTFAVGGDSELTDGTPNTFFSLFLGFVIAVVIGIFTMVVGYIVNLNVAFLIITGFSFILAFIGIFLLYFRLEKSYDRIMHR